MVIAGVMSGSSLDGLDIAIVQFEEDMDWTLLWVDQMEYSNDWVERLRNYDGLSATEYIKFKSDYSYYVGACLKSSLDKFDGEVDYVSFHGHTLLHLPEDGVTEQIGNGGIIAGLLDVPTLTDFRVQDVARGGVGAPIAPIAEINLYSGHDYYLNLGGIANLTRNLPGEPIAAFDVCPCNQVLNYFSNTLGLAYDDEGRLAKSGSLLPDLEKWLDTVSYFTEPPPKTLDNNWIVHQFIPQFPKDQSAEDVLHTYTHWMSQCITREVNATDRPSSLIVTGGGAHNTYFMECLRRDLASKNCNLVIPSKETIDNKEAILMALMAHLYLKDEVNILKDVTGANRDSIGGGLFKVY